MDAPPVLGFVDSHCHLNFDDFDPDRSQVIERARLSGVSRILVPGIDLETSRSALDLADQYPEVYAAVGIHPNSGAELTENSLAEIKRLARHDKVVAIGEIGLDYYRQQTAKDIQISIFRQQLELAAELELAVVVHNRDASDDLLEILARWHQELVKSSPKLARLPGVLHSFSASQQVASAALKLGFKLGIAGPVTFRNSLQLQNVVVFPPMEDLLIETDAPYQTPHPFRGQRNEPANVRIVAEKIAELKQAPVDVVARITTESADLLFDWRIVH